MNTAPLFLLAFSLIRPLCASGPPDIFIATAQTGISYRLVDHNRRSEKAANTLDEVGAWSSDRVKEGEADMVMIYPDDFTSFRTVLDLLRRLKTAGVKQFAVGAVESTEGGKVFHRFRGKTDTVESSFFGRAAPSNK